MEPLNVGLVVFSIGLLVTTFYFNIKTPQPAKVLNNKVVSISDDMGGSISDDMGGSVSGENKDKQDVITVQLPGKILGDNQYVLDLKVSYIKSEGDSELQKKQKPEVTDHRKKPYGRLDRFI